MKKFFSSPKVHVIDLEPENVITSSNKDWDIGTQSLDDEEGDSQKARSRGGIWDDM